MFYVRFLHATLIGPMLNFWKVRVATATPVKITVTLLEFTRTNISTSRPYWNLIRYKESKWLHRARNFTSILTSPNRYLRCTQPAHALHNGDAGCGTAKSNVFKILIADMLTLKVY